MAAKLLSLAVILRVTSWALVLTDEATDILLKALQ